jgi:nicotinate-nucleotide pyrophosphorylase (carboxylating)
MAHMLPPLDTSRYHNLIQTFLREDLGAGDLTTEATVPGAQWARGELLVKAPLVLAGVELFAEVFRLLDSGNSREIIRRDGDFLVPGAIPARIRGSARALLTGERVALNLLQRMSGVATLTRRYVQAVEGTGAKILDTRKTTPGLRELEKYAVRAGGGKSHRRDLGEAILIKDNHIRLAGGVGPALAAAQAYKSRVAWIEVEVTDLEELREAVSGSSDVILLDNMGPALVREAVEFVRKRDPEKKIRTEASGGITLENVREFAEAGADWISVGALTHSAPAVDLSFEIEPE